MTHPAHAMPHLRQLTRKLELDSLRLLAVVCSEGSYAKAAHVEPLTASAISKRITELERGMGCVLLERSSQGVRPTKVGELVVAHWAEVAASLHGLHGLLATAGLPGTRPLEIGQL